MKAVLFDIGNVLLFFDHGRSCRQIAELCGATPSAVRDAVFRSGLEREYDEGRISTRDFIRRLKATLSLNVPDETVRRIWCDIFWPNAPVLALAARLAPTHRLILVSNTNEMHMAYLWSRFPELRGFHGAALSYEVGARKPACSMFEAAWTLAGVQPRDCVYVDDIAEYCQAARRLGMRAVHYEPGLDLAAALAPRETREARGQGSSAGPRRAPP